MPTTFLTLIPTLMKIASAFGPDSVKFFYGSLQWHFQHYVNELYKYLVPKNTQTNI